MWMCFVFRVTEHRSLAQVPRSERAPRRGIFRVTGVSVAAVDPRRSQIVKSQALLEIESHPHPRQKLYAPCRRQTQGELRVSLPGQGQNKTAHGGLVV
jgi:hypothetical protein